MASSIIRNFIAKKLFQQKGAIANRKSVDFSANALEQRLTRLGVNTRQISSEKELNQLLAYVKQMEDQAFNQEFSGILKANKFQKNADIIDFPQKRSFKQEVDDMVKDGTITKGTAPKQSDKVRTRQMFKDSNLNKTEAELKTKFDKQNKEAVERLKNKRQLDEDEIAELDEDIGGLEYTNDFDGTVGSANKLRKERADYIRDMELEYKKGNLDPKPGEANRERFLQKKFDEMESSGDNRLMTRDEIEELSSFGRQKDMDKSIKNFKEKDFKQKKTLKDFNPEDRDPNADGGVAGLLGERQNFKMGKRAFLKFLASGAAGIAGLKSGIFGFGKGGAKKAVTETVKQTAGSGTPPPYFFKLVEKIKTRGDDVTPNYATKDREVVTKYKDYTLTEDIATGEKTIQRMKIDEDLKYDASDYYGKPVGEEVYINYKPGKGQVDETMKGKTPPDEYIEDTSLIRGDKPAEGEVMDTFDGVPDDILKEVGETIVKKADGGRIGLSGGGGLLKLFKFLKPKPKKLETVESFLSKRKFLKDIVGNTEKNKKARELRMLKEAAEEARKNPGFKFENVDIDKDIRPIFDKEIAESLKKNRKLNATGGLASMLGE